MPTWSDQKVCLPKKLFSWEKKCWEGWAPYINIQHTLNILPAADTKYVPIFYLKTANGNCQVTWKYIRFSKGIWLSKSGNEKDYWSAAKLPGSGSQKLSIFHTGSRERLSISRTKWKSQSSKATFLDLVKQEIQYKMHESSLQLWW